MHFYFRIQTHADLPVYSSDYWGFGCILYQILAGRPPFQARTEYLMFQKIINLEYEFPLGFPPDAKDLVEKLLVSSLAFVSALARSLDLLRY